MEAIGFILCHDQNDKWHIYFDHGDKAYSDEEIEKLVETLESWGMSNKINRKNPDNFKYIDMIAGKIRNFLKSSNNLSHQHYLIGDEFIKLKEIAKLISTASSGNIDEALKLANHPIPFISNYENNLPLRQMVSP